MNCKPGSAAYVRQAIKRESQYVAEIETLRAWIKDVGGMADLCTRHVLGEVCEHCRCPYGAKQRAKAASLAQSPAATPPAP